VCARDRLVSDEEIGLLFARGPEDAEQSESLARIKQGGIPAGARAQIEPPVPVLDLNDR
jgi:hypothetical protein